MVAGLNVRADIWRLNEQSDDGHGGAQSSGTVLHSYVQSRIEDDDDQMLLVQQPGMETLRTFSAIVIPGTLDIRESDEYQVVDPSNHPYYEQKFRVIRVKYPNIVPNNPNNYMRLKLTRSVRAHQIQ